MAKSYTKPDSAWIKQTPTLEQIARGVYSQQCDFIGRDHEGVCSALIEVALKEAENRGLLRAARICECMFGSLTTEDAFRAEKQAAELIRKAIDGLRPAGWFLPVEGGYAEKRSTNGENHNGG